MLEPEAFYRALLTRDERFDGRIFVGVTSTGIYCRPVCPAGPAKLEKTWSYAQLARHIGRPRAVRAVGAANGANPVGLVVPCHGVIGKDGSLTGYGGGVDRERWLLAHEREHLAE